MRVIVTFLIAVSVLFPIFSTEKSPKDFSLQQLSSKNTNNLITWLDGHDDLAYKTGSFIHDIETLRFNFDEPYATFPKQISHFTHNAATNRIAYVTPKKHEVELTVHDLTSNKQLGVWDVFECNALAFSEDGEKLLYSCSNTDGPFIDWPLIQYIKEIELDTFKKKKLIARLADPLTFIAHHKNPDILAVGEQDQDNSLKIALYRLQNGFYNNFRELPPTTAPLTSFAFNKSGNKCAFLLKDGMVLAYDLVEQNNATFKAHNCQQVGRLGDNFMIFGALRRNRTPTLDHIIAADLQHPLEPHIITHDDYTAKNNKLAPTESIIFLWVLQPPSEPPIEIAQRMSINSPKFLINNKKAWINPDIFKQTYARLPLEQRLFVDLLHAVEWLNKERHETRRHEPHYHHTQQMPMSLRLIEKYNPAIPIGYLDKQLTSIENPLRTYLVQRFNIVKKMPSLLARVAAYLHLK